MTDGRQEAGVPLNVVEKIWNELRSYVDPQSGARLCSLNFGETRNAVTAALSGYTLLPRSEVGESAQWPAKLVYMATDTKDASLCTLKLHFDARVTDELRAWVLEALNHRALSASGEATDRKGGEDGAGN